MFSAIFFVFLSVGCYATLSNFEHHTFDGKNVVFSGKIVQSEQKREGAFNILFESCFVTDESGTTSQIPGRVWAYVTPSNVQDFALFNRVVFEATLKSNTLFENGQLNSYYLKNNIKYSIDRQFRTTAISSTDASTAINKLHKINKQILIENVGEESAEMMFALLYGNKSNAPSNLVDLFKQNGIAHLLSVSGLHVAILIGVLMFFLSKSKMSELFKFILTALFLIVFCTLCSFSPATVRASIMALVLALSRLFVRKYDIVNSLSLAGVLLLIASPTSLFDVGFQMSFGAVFGIVFVGGAINRFGIKNKFAKAVVLSLTATLSAQIGIFPVLAKHYFISLWSIVANLVIVPIFGVLYSTLFVVNFVVLLLPFLSTLFVLPKALLDVVIYSNVLLAKLPSATLYFSAFGAFATTIFYFSMFVASNLVVLKARTKSLALVICTVAFLGAIFASNSAFSVSFNSPVANVVAQHAQVAFQNPHTNVCNFQHFSIPPHI